MLDVSVRDATDAFDHILLGARDLDVGIRWVEERTGVRAKFGGNHPGGGTCNALLSLGMGHYLEIIAPDPAQANAPDVRKLGELSLPSIIQWAIHTEDIAAAKSMVEAAGIKTVGPRPGSRQRPDGKVLRWQTLEIEQTTPLVPFFYSMGSGFAASFLGLTSAWHREVALLRDSATRRTASHPARRRRTSRHPQIRRAAHRAGRSDAERRD
ncbi:MAG: VOC family protein [Candidatus Sulfotelmatobacter sp.]